MKKIILTVLISSLTLSLLFAQKSQRIAYIDSEYILENMPEYVEAQANLNEKISKWQQVLNAKKNEVEQLKADLNNQKALLTKELILDKEEDISIKETELQELQKTYFGPNGDLFFMRKQLVKPIQDQMYNAVKEIADSKKYDFVFDKTSDLIMLYSNNAYDISELVLNSISRSKRKDEMETRRAVISGNQASTRPNNQVAEESDEEVKSTVAEDREAAKIAREEQQKAIIAEKQKQREEQRQKVITQREENLKKREEAKQAALKKKETESATKTTDSKVTEKIKQPADSIKVALTDTLKVEKDSLTPQQRAILDRQQKKEAQQKAIQEQREKALKEREALRKKNNN